MTMEDGAQAWFRRQTSHWRDWPIEQLMSWKRGSNTRISVVIPARNEQATVGAVAGAVARAFMREQRLVDELVVMDSDFTDGTAEAAARAGATVYGCRDVAPGLGAHPGQGEALWKSLFVTTGDIVVFLDADLTRWGTHFVTGLTGPLLDPSQEALLVKACFDRISDGQAGGRVTELVARPLLNLWWPQLAGVAQPWRASGRPAGRSWRRYRYRSAMAWSWPCSSIRSSGTGSVQLPRSTWENARTGTSRTGISRSWRPNCCWWPSAGARPAPTRRVPARASGGQPRRSCASSPAKMECCARCYGWYRPKSGIRRALWPAPAQPVVDQAVKLRPGWAASTRQETRKCVW